MLGSHVVSGAVEQVMFEEKGPSKSVYDNEEEINARESSVSSSLLKYEEILWQLSLGKKWHLVDELLLIPQTA